MSASKHFMHYNPNPAGKETGDCVIRSICTVTGLSWLEVYDKASALARENYTVLNNQDFLPTLFEHFGLKRVKVPKPKKGEKSLTVAKFCEEHKTGLYILNLAHHNVGVSGGMYWDLYPNDTSKVYSYWEM